MSLTTTHARPRRAVAALAAATALTLGGSLAVGGGIAAAGPDDLAPRPEEPAAVTLNPATIRLIVAVAACSEMYPPGTDITDCVKNIY